MDLLCSLFSWTDAAFWCEVKPSEIWTNQNDGRFEIKKKKETRKNDALPNSKFPLVKTHIIGSLIFFFFFSFSFSPRHSSCYS